MSLDSLTSLTGGGGLSGGGAGPSGATTGTSATGAKNINIGGNPNLTSGSLKWPMIVGAVALAYFAWRRFK